jgi:uncharacterized protein YegJ (DUF2314 family)
MNRESGLLLLFALLAGSCAPAEAPSPAGLPVQPSRPAVERPPARNLMENYIQFEFALYFLPKPSKDPLAELDVLLKKDFAFFKRADKLEENPKQGYVAARIETDVQSKYAPPNSQSIQYFGRGLSREQGEALERSQTALVLDFAYPKKHVWDGMRSALNLTDALAANLGGLIWDEETREVFTQVAWNERRIKTWTDEFPEIAKHTVMHAYKKDEYARAISLGMIKFGLPDVVIEEFSWTLEGNMGHVLNMFAQSLAEGPVIAFPGDFDLDFKSIKNAKVREPQMTTLKLNATGVALLRLKKGTWEEGDPKNRLVEITFERGLGPDIHAKQDQVLSAAFGWEDRAMAVKHSEELEAARRQARTKLPGLRAEFNKGLAPGEFIELKAPFTTPDGGTEWMWVEVITWNGDKISGLLKNEPFNIPTLHGGQTVEVSESKVFDYIRRHADGTTEGNETSKIIEKLSK